MMTPPMADERSARLSPLSWGMVALGMKKQSGFKRRMSPNGEAPVPPDSRATSLRFRRVTCAAPRYISKM